MRHNIKIDGVAYRLRPVTVQDAALIVEMRSDAGLSRFLHPISPLVSDQEEWLGRYFERPNDYYFIVEHIRSGQGEGAVGIYDLDNINKCAEWGRWILRRGSMAALESAILVYRAAFEILGLSSVYCRTVADNTRVVSFHSSFGLVENRRLGNHMDLGEGPVDAVEHRMTSSMWEDLRPSLETKARRLAMR